MNFETASYAQVLADLDAATDWLKAIGVRLPGASRIESYRSALRRIADEWEAGNSSAIAREMRVGDLANVLFECAQWREIYRAIGVRADSALTEKMRTFVKGPAAYSDEKASAASNKARDVAFELSIAARLCTAGIEVDFTPRPDLVAFFEGYAVFIECKRLQTGEKLRKRVREAHRVLAYRCAGGVASRGLVALSITKIVNPNAGLLDVPDRAALQPALNGVMDQFIGAHGARWAAAPSTGILGALLEFRCCTRVHSPPMLAPGGNTALHFVGELGTFDHRFSLRFAERLARQPLVSRPLESAPPSTAWLQDGNKGAVG